MDEELNIRDELWMHSHVFVWLSLRVKCWNNLVFEHKAVEVSPARRNCLHSMSSLTWPSYFTFWECNPDLMTCLPVQRECWNAFSVINLFLPLGLFLEIFFVHIFIIWFSNVPVRVYSASVSVMTSPVLEYYAISGFPFFIIYLWIYLYFLFQLFLAPLFSLCK